MGDVVRDTETAQRHALRHSLLGGFPQRASKVGLYEARRDAVDADLRREFRGEVPGEMEQRRFCVVVTPM